VREGDIVIIHRLARLGRTTHTIQLVEKFNYRGMRFLAFDLGIDSRTPASKLIIGVFSNQYERENNREKSLTDISLAMQ
jgi:DNA invertase Pin-like site-specific DNA recombinase